MSALLRDQLAMHQHLQRKAMRARHRYRRQPTDFHKRQKEAYRADAALFADALLMRVPTAHDEAVYALALPGFLHFQA